MKHTFFEIRTVSLSQPALKLFFILFLFFAGSFYFGQAWGKNLGTIGTTYVITETDFLEMIERKIQEKQKSGELSHWQKRFQEDAVRHILRPTPVRLTTTSQPRIFYFDPTLKLHNSIKDHLGHILIKAGTTFNPLTVVHWNKTLLFLDADDSRQIHWAKEQLKQVKIFKIILIKGNIKLAEQQLQQTIYFDQEGRFSKHFKLKHIPCLIEPGDLRLKIQEFALRD